MSETTTRASVPRDRLLATASRLFYAEGIRAIGVDRLFVEASVTRATFYRHYPSKQHLVVAYIESRDAQYRSQLAEAAVQLTDPVDLLHALIVVISETVCGPDFHGCPFINAAAEFPDPADPVHRAVQAHRDWLHGELVRLLTAAGHPEPGRAARTLVMLRDGAMVGGRLDDRQDVVAALSTAVELVIRHP